MSTDRTKRKVALAVIAGLALLTGPLFLRMAVQ